MAGAPREKEIVEQVREELKRRRMFFWKTSPGTYGTPAGMPDFILCFRGLFVGLEVKRPIANSVVNPAQERVHGAIRASGGWVYVVRSRAEAVAALTEIEALLGPGGPSDHPFIEPKVQAVRAQVEP